MNEWLYKPEKLPDFRLGRKFSASVCVWKLAVCFRGWTRSDEVEIDMEAFEFETEAGLDFK